MQYHTSSEYSSSEYCSFSAGLNPSDMGLFDFGGGGRFGGQKMMMASAGGKKHGGQPYRHNQSQAQANYGMDEYGMHNCNNRYGEYGQAYQYSGGSSNIVPYGASDQDHISYNKTRMSKANTEYGAGYGGHKQAVTVGNGSGCVGGGSGGGRHYMSKQQAQYSPGGVEYMNGMNQQRQMHKQRKSEKSNMFQKMQAMSMSSSSSSVSSRSSYNTRSINHSDEEDFSDGEYFDGHNFGSDDEYYDSGSDYECSRRRNYGKPRIY